LPAATRDDLARVELLNPLLLPPSGVTVITLLQCTLNQFVTDRPPIWSFAGSYRDDDGFVLWLKYIWTALLEWISQPRRFLSSMIWHTDTCYIKAKRWLKDVLAVIIAWAVTFTVVCIIILGLGFGPVGVGAGK
jgi:hypothetical protein